MLLRIMLATAWSGLLCLGGLWILLEWPNRFPSYRTVCIVGGITGLAMGQFVFAALVADRLLPKTNLWVSWGVEGVAALVYAVGLVWLAMWLSGVIR